jgi:hypothetical protein
MEEYQIKKLSKYRKRNKFSLFPFIVVNGFDSDFIWTGKWFKKIKITEQKIKERYLDFDDGWSYKYFWTKWKTKWKFLKIEDD